MDNINAVDVAILNLVKITYGNGHGSYKRFSKNLKTNNFVAEYWNGDIASNILCDVNDSMTYSHSQFGTVGSVSILDNTILFTELEKLL